MEGKTVKSAGLRNLNDLFLAEIYRNGAFISPVTPKMTLEANDTLFFTGALEEVNGLLDLFPRGLKTVEEKFEVDARHDLGGAQVRHQLPDWFAGGLRPEVPDSVNDRAGGEMHDAIVGAEPAQLRISGELLIERPHIAQKFVKVTIHDVGFQTFQSRHLNIVASTNGEHRRMPALTSGDAEAHIGGGVVGIRIHGIRAIKLLRGGEANVLG